MRIVIFRYGHRTARDHRITTHCCLVARAFGADEILIHGLKDNTIIEGIENINRKFGGNFKVNFVENIEEILKKYKNRGYSLIHLTMYGYNIEKTIKELKKKKKLFVIIGSKKVPKRFYEVSDYNIAIGNQPHSEVAALAILLDKIVNKNQLNRRFSNWKLKIIESNNGKKVKLKK